MKLLGAPALLFALVAFLVLAACAGVALALFTDTPSVPSNAFTSDTLDSPAALSAACGSSIALNWTATPDTYAAGYRVLRGTVSGGPYTQIAQVTPRTTTTYIDTPGAGTYYYVARAFYQNWESANSNEASAVQDANCTTTGFLTCTSNAAVTSSSGDNNGFQLNPGNLCADDSAFAEDTDSGSNTNTTCSSTGKDRHLFYNYNLSVPSGSTINGIEVRLDAWADAAAGSPFMCVELSWDGGTTWTASKTTPTLSTAETNFIAGSGTDTWGRTWSPAADFASANFRVRVTDVASDTTRDFRLDWVAVNVSYVPGSGTLTGFHSCSSNAAVTSSSGDNNGFQLNPGNLCADDSAFAEDTNSGTNTNTTCADVGKDRHLLYDHNLSIPSGSTINGIEVRLDAWADATTGSPFMCVELSWDGGATWTAAKTTPTLGTSETTFILGATTDTWGRTWSAADFANANFRVRITDVASNISRDFRLDWAAVQVDYVPGSGQLTGFLSCSSNAAVTSSSGDNNGFQLNPGNLCANDSAFAEDTNSGTNTNTTCADVGKDRHLLYDHNLSIPSGSTINGIEVRLDAWADSAAGNPFMCVELSWDGGATWTATKTTPTLGTSETTFILGATTDTWGRTWSSGDFSNANLRVRITDVASNNARDFRLDWVAVQVGYTPP